MKDYELDELFTSADNEPVDDATRQKAVNAALAAFDDQGSLDTDRPTTNITSLFRRKSMKQVTERWVASGVASAAVIVLAVAMVFNAGDTQLIDGQPMPEPMKDKKIAGREFTIDVVPGKSIDQREETDSFDDQRVEASASTSANDTNSVSSAAVEYLSAPTSEANESRRNLPENAALEEVAVLQQHTRLSKEASMSVKPAIVQSHRSMLGSPRPDALLSDSVAPRVPSGNDNFEQFDTNPVQLVSDHPVSTFSIDVDTASYSFVRRQLNQGVLPQKAAVRLEELVNYFPYDYAVPQSKEVPFAAHVNVMASPWNKGNQLVHIGIKGFEQIEKPAKSNLVFLLDVSGSMSQPDKLPLVKQSMSLLLSQLQPEDTVAIAVYAGAAGTVLEPTPAREKQKIFDAMNRLQAGGSTAGAAGIKLAYQLAEANFVEGGVNRVFIATDGDFNVGITSRDELTGFIERKRDQGIYLSVLGFGQGNYNDALMQKLAQNGNGMAAYIDTLGEAQKVLVDEAQSTLFPIANDVKIQIEFNPATVKEYRLLGYETRMLAKEDFNNDKVDAGEIGAGHTVTAIYEVTPVGATGLLEESRYTVANATNKPAASELGFLKLRYKLPGESASKLISQPIPVMTSEGDQESRFAVAVAGFSQLLKDGKYLNEWSFDEALALAIANKGEDTYGYRAEFTQLIRRAKVASEM